MLIREIEFKSAFCDISFYANLVMLITKLQTKEIKHSCLGILPLFMTEKKAERTGPRNY